MSGEYDATDSEQNKSTREAEFLKNLAGAYRDIYASGLSIVGNRADADDVIQEVCVVLWQKFDEFEQGTSFRKWACTVAFNVAKSHSRHQRRRRGCGLSEEALVRVAQTQQIASEVLELRRQALRCCLDQMPQEDRQFLLRCYQDRRPISEVARQHDLPVANLYTRLKRLRRNLAACIRKQMGRSDSVS